ncbi:YgjV family protein [Salinimonas sp. HHU 13199]|uniref:YgjV family protein n=1 Tax=Salinimonas profundi TaxID=2729140 RepID=A0ABR8LKZ7_9ALTE|nr:YgjV family protein [Salinimonas profundi]MBD3586876.1 YgjV family protein [Salinimonas profundi]
MTELLMHSVPVIIAVLSFWSNTERKLLFLNLGLCITIGSLLAVQQAWAGTLVMTVAGLSTTYRLVTNKLLAQSLTVVLIILMSALIGFINMKTGKTGWLEIMPLVTFILYRFGELYCKEAGLRLSMISGSLVFAVYALINQTWGVAVTELLFAISNSWFYLRLWRQARSLPL